MIFGFPAVTLVRSFPVCGRRLKTSFCPSRNISVNTHGSNGAKLSRVFFYRCACFWRKRIASVCRWFSFCSKTLLLSPRLCVYLLYMLILRARYYVLGAFNKFTNGAVHFGFSANRVRVGLG